MARSRGRFSLLFAIAFFCLAGSAFAQLLYDKTAVATVKTICVCWPIGSSQEARDGRAAVSNELLRFGYKTADCVSNPDADYDVQLWFYAYGGSVDSGQTHFYARTARGYGGTVVGSVIVDRPTATVGYWMIELYPKGRFLSVYRDARASSLDSGLKRLHKTIRKVQKHMRK